MMKIKAKIKVKADLPFSSLQRLSSKKVVFICFNESPLKLIENVFISC